MALVDSAEFTVGTTEEELPEEEGGFPWPMVVGLVGLGAVLLIGPEIAKKEKGK